MNIPSYIRLTDHRQIDKAKRFFDEMLKRIQKTLAPDYQEEDCAPQSPFIWHARDTSICTEIYITLEWYGFESLRCDLTIDDDNEISPDNW